jgi:chromosome segregation ATPase
LKLIHKFKFDKVFILGIQQQTQRISEDMRKVQDKVAKDVFMILIKQERDQALKIHTSQPEALGKSYLGKTDIIGKKFDMDFLVSAPNNAIEEAKKEILRLNQQVKALIDKEASYQSTIEIFKEKISRLEHIKSDLEKEIDKFKLEIKKPNKKLEECRPS